MDHDPTRRSTYQKIYKTRFQGTQVEALKDIHFTVEKGEYAGHHGGIRIREINSPQHPGHAGSADRRAGLPQWHRYLNHQEQGRLQLPPGKLGFVFQDFNLLDTLSVKDNIPPSTGSLSQTRQGNDEQGR